MSEPKNPRLGAQVLAELRADIDRYGHLIGLMRPSRQMAIDLADCIEALITLRNASMGLQVALTAAIAERNELRARAEQTERLLESSRRISAQRGEQLERAQTQLVEALLLWVGESERLDLIAEECAGAGHLVWHHAEDPDVDGEQVLIVSCEAGETLREGLDRAIDELEEELEAAPIELTTEPNG